MPRRRHDSFERFSLAHYLGTPFRAVWNWGSRLASDDSFRTGGRNPVVTGLMFPLRFLFSWALFFINSWAITRHVRPFLGGVPALLAITGVAGATWLDYFRYPNKVQRTQQYFEKFLRDPERGPEVAQHFAIKRVNLQPTDLEAKYFLADVWSRLGKSSRAEDLMNYLIDQDYVLAHVWFARQYLANREGISEVDRSAKVQSHLQHAIDLDPENSAAKIALADHLLEQASLVSKESPEYRNIIDQASKHLISVSESDSGDIIWHLPKLMKVLFELGDDERARRVFDRTSKMLYQYMRKFPADDRVPQIWMVLIGSAIQLKDYAQAEEMINEGRRQSKTQALVALFDELDSRMILERAADIENSDAPDRFDQVLELLSQAIQESPTNGLISNKLVESIVPNSTDGATDSSRLEKSRAVNAPAVAHLLLGMDKVLKGDPLGGQMHWRIAESQSPNAQMILFSLIRSLISQHAEKFQNRRDVIALAIEHFPNQGLFYFLRGTDSMNHGDYKLAVPDLEQAIQMVKEPGNFEIRFQLAKCYRELKEQDKLDDQRRILQSIVQRADPRQRGMLEDYLRNLDE